MARRFWTPGELERLKALYPKAAAAECASELGRTVKAIYQAAEVYGLKKGRKTRTDRRFLAALRRLNRSGYSDTEIAGELGCERHTVTRHRRRLGLPSNARGERYKARVRENTRKQCEAWGVESVGELRSLVFRIRSLRAGWPVDLRPREVDILEALARRGPMSRPEIAAAIGMRWAGKKTFGTKAPGGSYLAHLIRRGLVVDLGRLARVTGQGKGRSRHMYDLAIGAERREA